MDNISFLQFIKEQETHLDEDFGNLKQFSKSVLQPLSVAMKDRRGKSSLLGQNSEVELATGRVTGASIKKALKTPLRGEEWVAIAVIVRIGEQDVMGVAPSSDKEFVVALDEKFIDKIFDAHDDEIEGAPDSYKKFADYILQDQFSGTLANGKTETVNDAVVGALVAKLIKVAKDTGVELTAFYIKPDPQRKAAQDDRRQAKKDVEIKPSGLGDPRQNISRNRWGRTKSEYERYIANLKSDLKDRLESFKNSKLSTIKSIDELIEYLKDHGLGDRFSYKGNKMKFYDSDNIESVLTGREPSSLGSGKMQVRYKNAEFGFGGAVDIYDEMSKVRKQAIADIEKEVEAGRMSIDDADREVSKRVHQWYKDEQHISGITIILGVNKDDKLKLDIEEVDITYGIMS